MMFNNKGREEVKNLLRSTLINDWQQASSLLKNTVRMLLAQRPDLIKLYFTPAAWEFISQHNQRQSSILILAAFKSEAITLNKAPEVTHWEQAVFYIESLNKFYIQQALDWANAHPEECPKTLKAPPIHLPELTDDSQ